MMDFDPVYLIYLLGGYLIGSISTAIITCKSMNLVDEALIEKRSQHFPAAFNQNVRHVAAAQLIQQRRQIDSARFSGCPIGDRGFGKLEGKGPSRVFSAVFFFDS